jgi:hypothetical protein
MNEQHGEFGELIIEGLEEALAHMRGERPDLRTVRFERREEDMIERVETHDGKTTREVRHPRTGWEAALERMAQRGDDRALDPGTTGTSWDEEEWEWPEDE